MNVKATHSNASGFNAKDLSETQLETCVEELFRRYYNRMDGLVDSIGISRFGFKAHAKGQAGRGFEMVFAVALDSGYVSDADPSASSLCEAFNEAARRCGYDKHRSVRLITHDAT